jgi:hypothetical protein
MTFNIRKSNGSLIAQVDPGTSNHTASSLIFFGKNFANYGTALNENMLHLMEHFADQSPPANPTIGQLWYDTINREMKVWESNLQWNLLNARSLQSIAEQLIPNRLYVSKGGNDANTGRSWFTAKRTIRAACEAADLLLTVGEFEDDHVTILVSSGDYEEDCPITVPPGVSIIGDNLRSVTVRPMVETSNVFLLNSQTYMYGFTVRGHRLEPSALDITPLEPGRNADGSGLGLPRNTDQTGFAFSFAPGASILVSPYIQNCSSISGDEDTGSGIYPGGGGVLVDPSVCAEGNRINSIVVDAFTQINLGGIGCKVVGKGYMQLVSFFINFCQFGLLCVDGGHVTALNSNCSFGNYSLWAEGSRWLDSPEAVNDTFTGDGFTREFFTTQGTKIYPDQLLDLVITINGVEQSRNRYRVRDGVDIQSRIIFDNAPPAGSTISVRIRFGSLIEASGYTMSYTGAGLSYNKLSASQGGTGRADPNKYTIALDGGKIYHTTTDEGGDFYVGLVTPGAVDPITGIQASARPNFRINQRRGAIDGRAFYQSIFGFMAPFVLALTRRGK